MTNKPYVSPLERNVRYCLSGESDVVQCREAVRTLWALKEKADSAAKELIRERDDARGAATRLCLSLGDAQIENYSLTRERDELAKTLRFYRSCDAVEDDGKRATEVLARLESGELRSKCPVCGWPLASTAKEGCVPGNCSYRGGAAGGGR